jgi:LuxR family transcriptional regulator, quorum-sensing system regulator CinR
MSHLSPDPSVARLIETLRAAKDLETALRSIAKDIGVSNVCCVRFSSVKKSDAKALTVKVTYPFRWQARYFLKQYASIDPVLSRGKTAVDPFDWEELVTDDPAVRQFFDDAARHGVGQNGYSIPVRPDPEADFSIVSFNSDHPKEEWVRFKAENTGKMAQLAILIHSAAQKRS